VAAAAAVIANAAAMNPVIVTVISLKAISVTTVIVVEYTTVISAGIAEKGFAADFGPSSGAGWAGALTADLSSGPNENASRFRAAFLMTVVIEMKRQGKNRKNHTGNQGKKLEYFPLTVTIHYRYLREVS